MNTKQYADYYNEAYNTMKNGLKGTKYREVELLGDAAATIATNQMQMELTREESEKAYERSKASNQVNLMMQAGMSRAGAINALNGGGSYTPAPISLESPKPGTGVSNVRQNDLATAQNALSGINSMVANWQQYQQIKNQNDQFNKQLEEQKRQFNLTAQLEREKFAVQKESIGYDNIVKTLQAEKLVSESAIANIDYLLKEFTYTEELSAQKAEIVARKASAILESFRSEKVTNAMAEMTEEELDNLFELQATLNMLQQGLQYDSTGAMIKGGKKLLQILSAGKTGGRHIRYN